MAKKRSGKRKKEKRVVKKAAKKAKALKKRRKAKPLKPKTLSELRKVLRKKHEEGKMLSRQAPAVIAKPKFSAPFAVLFLLSLAVSVIAILNSDWIVSAVTLAIMFLSLIFFRIGRKVDVAVKKHSPKFYLIIWVFSLVLGGLSVYRKNNFSLVIAIVTMFFCSVVASASHKKTRTTSLKRDVNELRKRSKRYETDLDKLLILLEKYKKLKVSQISEGFGVTSDMVEEWADTLEKHNLLSINFPAFSGMELVIKGKKEEEKEKKEKEKEEEKKEEKGKK